MSTSMLSDREEAIRKIKQGIRGFLDQILERTDKQLDMDIMERAEVIDGSTDGKASFLITLDSRYANGGGALHAAVAGMIFDCYTCLAFTPLLPDWSSAMHNQGPPGGLTRSLNVSFLRPVPLPATVRVDAEVLSNGRAATYARATMSSPDGKKVYGTCDHHKIQVSRPGSDGKGWSKGKAKL